MSFATCRHSSRVGTTTSTARRAVLGRGAEALQQRDAEAQRLAGAGARLADEVLAGQGQRQRQLLDGERVLDAVRGERLDDLGDDAQLGERGGVLRGDRGRHRGGGELLGGLGIGGGGGCVGAQRSAFLTARAREVSRLARPPPPLPEGEDVVRDVPRGGRAGWGARALDSPREGRVTRSPGDASAGGRSRRRTVRGGAARAGHIGRVGCHRLVPLVMIPAPAVGRQHRGGCDA